VFTLLFASKLSLPIFTMAWIGNRLTQSVAWAGLIKVSSKWFDFSSYGMIIGILSISYLIGDAAARQWMGMLIAHGFGWRICSISPRPPPVLLGRQFFFLRESRLDAGYSEAKPNPLNLYAGSEERPQSVGRLLLPLLRSRAFLLVCLLSLGCTTIRETFNAWTPVYLSDYLGYSPSNAARMSGIFPGVGAVSVLVTGWLSDRLGVNGRSLILFVGLTATAAALLFLMTLRSSSSGSLLPLFAIGVIAFCLLGPYSYLGGAIALDFGGKQAGAVSSGIIDGVGYMGAVAAGYSIARCRCLSVGREYSLPWPSSAPWRRSVPDFSMSWRQSRRKRKSSTMNDRTEVKRLWSQPDTLASNGPMGRPANSPACGCATICAKIEIPTADSA